MEKKIYTVEELMLDEGFLDFCLYHDSAYKPYWEHVIDRNPEQHQIFVNARNNIQTLNGGLSSDEILFQIEKVKEHINKIEAKDSSSQLLEITDDRQTYSFNKRKSSKKIFLYGVAACLVLICGFYFIYPTLVKPQTQTTNSFITVYNTVQGERKKILLPDGTIALLNTNSQLAINNDYNNEQREIELKGEGFFMVAKNASKPFIVHSNNFSTTAVGTEFYVHARNTENAYKVDLLEGKVKLNNNNNTLMLSQGEDAEWNSFKRTFSKSTFDSGFLKRWIKGEISFDKTPVKEAIETLNKWYAVDIEVKRKDILRQSVSGSYNNASLEDILKIVCFTFSCKYIYVNNKVIIQ
jgi:transmembrane sensor